MTHRIPLTPIHEANRCDVSKLETVDTFDGEDHAYYDLRGWNRYRPEYHIRSLLPEIGWVRYYGSSRVVIPLAGKNYRLTIDDDGMHDDFEAEGKTLVLEETDEPETMPDRTKPLRYERGGYRLQVFGQPTWVQGERFPADEDGNPCSHLCTVENGWGDSGNWNVLVSLDSAGFPVVAYFEASCC